MKTRTKATLGAAAAATGAALAAAYYLYGSEDAAKHRRQLKKWARDAEREIVQAARKAKNKVLTDRNVRALITEAAHRYRMTKDLDPKDVRDFVARMQSRWYAVREALEEEGTKGKRAKRGRQRRVRTAKKSR
ncbi:MAG TPA: hypothetical protein VNM40_02205 [Candidatus Paceibacterota bacterium]|nr:hypothetical protein [Candidatus Paceibacterota bacterium]